MTQTTALETAIAFTTAWTSHDIQSASDFVADDVVFDGPMQKSTGARDYIDGLRRLSRDVTGFRMIAAFGDADQALLMYDLLTDKFGVLTCAKHLTISGGKIVRDQLTFDSYRIRSGGSD